MGVVLQINDNGTTISLEMQDPRVQLVGPVTNTLSGPTTLVVSSGPAGPAGPAGLTLRNGAGAPSSGLGSNGEFYIDTTAKTIYGPKTSGSWGTPTSLIGPAGTASSLSIGTITTGAAGSSAAATITGSAPAQTLNLTIPRGSTGLSGTDGKTLLTGTTAPSNSLGVDGDSYFDKTAKNYYGPKAGGVWPAAVSLIGATGNTGPAGADATIDGTGDSGWHPGDYGLLAWTGDILFYTSNFTLGTAGKAYIVSIKVRRSMTVSSIVTAIRTAGTGLTAGNCRAALWTSGGTLVGQTADQSTAWATAGRKDMALTGGPFGISAGTYYIGFWFNGTAGPNFVRNAANSEANSILTGGILRAGDGNSGLTNSAGTLTVGASSSNFLWAGIS